MTALFRIGLVPVLVTTLCLLLWSGPAVVHGFVVVRQPPSPSAFTATTTTTTTTTTSLASAATKATLTAETVWKVRVTLRGMETQKGKRVDEVLRFDANFIEDQGYEPPQGSLVQIVDDDDDDASSSNNNSNSNRFKITKSRWQLSEDPDDRKDGLWIWGLFAEPLYPFLLLQMETKAIALDNDDVIAPLQLYAQINHRRDDNLGVVLQASDLKVRKLETIKADPFGAAKVDVYQEVSVGSLSLQPAS